MILMTCDRRAAVAVTSALSAIYLFELLLEGPGPPELGAACGLGGGRLGGPGRGLGCQGRLQTCQELALNIDS